MIILLYGEDVFRRTKKLKEFKDKFLREVDKSGNSISEIDGEIAGFSEIKSKLVSSSLFSRKEMVIIYNILANKSKSEQANFSDYLRDIKQTGEEKIDNIIIFIERYNKDKFPKNKLAKTLQNADFSQEFRPLSNTQVSSWIKEEIKKRGGFIRPLAANFLGSFFGNNLLQLDKEIDKLISYKRGQTIEIVKDGGEAFIENIDIELLCRGNADENIFAFTDALSRRNKQQAIKLFEQEIEAGVAEQYLLYMIIRQFKILLQVRQAVDSGLSSRKIINQLKLHPFVANKSISQVRNFEIKTLLNILSRLIKIEKDSKSGGQDMKTQIDLLIAKL